MKYFLLVFIKIYWLIIPENKRKRCIFRVSCSKHVYQTTVKKGFARGLKALYYRYKNCRHGFEIFDNPQTQQRQIILKNNEILSQDEIATRFLPDYKEFK